MRIVFVHGACVKDGDWWWHRTGAVLQARGISSVAPALPSCGETGQPPSDGPGFDDDVAAVRAVLLDSDVPTTVVAHSYGGIVTAQAAADVYTVKNIVLVSSYLPEPGESLSSFAGTEPAPFLETDLRTGTFAARRDLFLDTFMHDCPGDIATESLHHLAAQTLSVTQQPVRLAAWKKVPTTYLVCTGDRGTQVGKQREFARRATRVVELDTGHHPFLSRPDAVADLITDLS